MLLDHAMRLAERYGGEVEWRCLAEGYPACVPDLVPLQYPHRHGLCGAVLTVPVDAGLTRNPALAKERP